MAVDVYAAELQALSPLNSAMHLGGCQAALEVLAKRPIGPVLLIPCESTDEQPACGQACLSMQDVT